MVSKKKWLEETLEREGIEVLIYNGNLDVIVNVAGTSRLVNSLQWSGKGEFVKSERKSFWVWNPETSRGELGNDNVFETKFVHGYFNLIPVYQGTFDQIKSFCFSWLRK